MNRFEDKSEYKKNVADLVEIAGRVFNARMKPEEALLFLKQSEVLREIREEAQDTNIGPAEYSAVVIMGGWHCILASLMANKLMTDEAVEEYFTSLAAIMIDASKRMLIKAREALASGELQI